MTRIESYTSEVDEWERLFKAQLADKLRLIQLKREQALLEGEHASDESRLAELHLAIGETESQILLREQTHLSEITSTMRETQAKNADLATRMLALEDKLQRTLIRTPVRGVVVGLQVRTEGAVISPGQPLMEIVPSSEDYVVVGRIDPAQVDSLRVGQSADIRFSAFDVQNTYVVEGELVNLSADVLQDPATGVGYYEAEIRVTENGYEQMRADGLDLLPGMPAETMIKTGGRAGTGSGDGRDARSASGREQAARGRAALRGGARHPTAGVPEQADAWRAGFCRSIPERPASATRPARAASFQRCHGGLTLTQPTREPLFPLGHFYSPIVDTESLAADAARVWPERPDPLGIDFNDAEHRYLLTEVFPGLLKDFDYPDTEDAAAYCEWLSQRLGRTCRLPTEAFVLLRHLRPKRVIEVGSGFSSLLMAIGRDGHLERFRLTLGDGSTTTLSYGGSIRHAPERIARRVQDVDAELWSELAAGDVLFIDSSHVAKTGSDVNHLCFEVLPRLRPGVLVHVHDIFLPQDYLKEWAIAQNRSWNEQYVVQALLMYSFAFRVKFGCAYAYLRLPELVQRALALPNGEVYGGGSLWIERLDAGR